MDRGEQERGSEGVSELNKMRKKNFAVEIKLLDNLLPFVSRCKSHKVYGSVWNNGNGNFSLFASTWFYHHCSLVLHERVSERKKKLHENDEMK